MSALIYLIALITGICSLFSNVILGVSIIIVSSIIYLFVFSNENKSNESNEYQKIKNKTNDLVNSGFKIGKSIYYSFSKLNILFDYENKKIAILENNYSTRIIDFNKILECKILENNSVIKEGGIGRAIIGGAIAGGAGAIVGAITTKSYSKVTSYSIRIITSDQSASLISLSLLPCSITPSIANPNYVLDEVELNCSDYKIITSFAEEVYGALTSIIHENNNKNLNFNKESDNIGKIKKLSDLQKEGIISNEEFEEKKNKLLRDI